MNTEHPIGPNAQHGYLRSHAMFQEDVLSPRKNNKHLTFNKTRRDRWSKPDEEVELNFSRVRQSQPRPATKRTLHHLVKFWHNLSDEYLEILETEPEGQWDA